MTDETILDRDSIYDALWSSLAGEIHRYATQTTYANYDSDADAEAEADAAEVLLYQIEDWSPATLEEAMEAACWIMQQDAEVPAGIEWPDD
ncbi:MAG: hypothetical protein ABSC06_30060 [Rhodopila sp.]|jgi:hypothetical protein